MPLIKQIGQNNLNKQTNEEWRGFFFFSFLNLFKWKMAAGTFFSDKRLGYIIYQKYLVFAEIVKIYPFFLLQTKKSLQTLE